MKFGAWTILLCCGLAARAQDLKSIIIDESANGKVFSTFLIEIEKEYGVDFIFDQDKIQAYTVHGITGRQRLQDYLQNFLIHLYGTGEPKSSSCKRSLSGARDRRPGLAGCI